MSLQNLKESYLYNLLPAGVLELDEKGLLAAVIGGVQDRLEDLRSYARRYELFFDTSGLGSANTVVLATYGTTYGKSVTRSLDLQHDTPSSEGAELTAWAAAQMDIDASAITSCVFGEDLLRFVDINTLQYIAANVGAVLHSTAAQSGTEQINQQRILDSYFPRLKIKGTAQSFDTLGRLLGFDDVRIIPLWGRLSPRVPSDFGDPTNDPDFSQIPQYWPQQTLGVAYNPYAMRDGSFYTWTGTVSSDETREYYYPESVNGRQPWVSVYVTGTVVHPAAGEVVTLAGGGPHVRAFALLSDKGLKFEALGEGESFNGLQLEFESWNSGTDRLISIVDRLSAIKYRTSYFDAALTMTDERAIAQFGTVSSKRSADLALNPTLTADGTATPPFRPWYNGSIATGVVYKDYAFTVVEGPGVQVPSNPRLQATSAQTEFNVVDIQSAAIQYVQVIEEVKPATRLPRKIQIGFLNRDQASYAAYLEQSAMGTVEGTDILEGIAQKAIGKPYYVTFTAVGNGTVAELPAELDPLSSGSLVNFVYPSVFAGTYNRSTDQFRIVPLVSAGTIVVYANWSPASTEVIRSYAGTDSLEGYQRRPEDDSGTATPFETVDEFPWRTDLVNGGDLVEVKGHVVSTVTEAGQLSVTNSVALKDQTGVEYNAYGVASTVEPIRVVTEAKLTDSTYLPGQVPIGYSGGFKSLDDISASDFSLPGRFSTDLDTYFVPGSRLFHVGMAQSVLVADLPRFFGPHHRDGLVGWLPLNEHPDDGASASDVSSTATAQSVKGFVLTGSFSSRLWSSERGWYLDVRNHGTVSTTEHREIPGDYSVSFWILPDGTVASTGTNPVFQHGPVKLDFPDDKNTLALSFFNASGTHHSVAVIPIQEGTWNNVAVEFSGSHAYYGAATLTNRLILQESTTGEDVQLFTEVGDAFIVGSGTNRGYGVQDVRMWSGLKTQEEIDKIHYHNPTSTICTYWPTNITIVSTGDRYGLKVTPSGFVYPDKLPPAVRMNQLSRITRYNSMGRYQGEERLKEVGLGGGTILPSVYVLGQQFYSLFATGTAVVSTAVGAMPGYNSLWLTEQNGTAALAPMASTNPCRSTIWLSGTDGLVYEVGLISVGTSSAQLYGTISAAPPGAEVLLSDGTVKLACASNGNVFQTSGTEIVTPPLFMYLNSKTMDDVPQAYDRWTGRYTPSAFGNRQSTPIAALDKNGQLEFENTSTLQPGYYRLTIVSGNIGKVDADFDGFSVEISVDTLLLVGRLCAGESGADFTATDVFEFQVTEVIPANWFMDVEWLNSYSNPSKGVARQLRIDSYKVEKIESDLFRIDLYPGTAGVAPAVTAQDVTQFNQNVGGGWLMAVNSYGTVCQTRHESQVYPQNDTVYSVIALSDLLTSNTAERREDQIVLSFTGSSVISEEAVPDLPVFSSPIVT